MKSFKKFIGEKAYNAIRGIAYDGEAIRAALLTPKNARAVFSDLTNYECQSLCAEISNSGTIGQVRETTKEEIVTAFNTAGYGTVIFDDENAISECQKYYQPKEIICTYNNLTERMSRYHMIVALKANINTINRSQAPYRDDEYGTSILNIQIARNGSHMSIKNRYNNTVDEPDRTLNNNLNILTPSLQSMVLGYYGFASLTGKDEAYYRNIVNIGGIYLKYYAERNNIYLGEFVLDEVNGARFTDTSRYYINNKNHYNNPYSRESSIILDYMTKTAFDVTAKHNGKAILYTRAMQEGLLDSSNKESDLTATFPDVKKELLKTNKNALRYINAGFGYDFTKPFTVTGFIGKFTAKSIQKATGHTSGILLVYSENKLKVAQMEDGKFLVDYPRVHYNISENIDEYYTKGCFEEQRKNADAVCFFVHQADEHIGEPKDYEGIRNYQIRSSILDSAGNDLTESRNNLQRRLKIYKSEKRKKEAMEYDFTTDIKELDILFAQYKQELVIRASTAESQKDFVIISNANDLQFLWGLKDYETIKKGFKEKKFHCVDETKEMIHKVKKRLINSIEIIKQKQ